MEGYILGAAVIYPGGIVQDLPGVDSGASTIYPGIIWEGGIFPDFTPGFNYKPSTSNSRSNEPSGSALSLTLLSPVPIVFHLYRHVKVKKKQDLKIVNLHCVKPVSET